MLIPKLEKSMGIEVYATDSLGIGGCIRRSVEDFVVEEVLVDGSKADLNPSEDFGKRRVLGSSSFQNRFLLCVLVKRNWDTFIAIKNIARQLGVKPSQIQIAGIKDAKAVTAQHVTIEGASAEEVQKVKVKDLVIYPIGYVRQELSPYYSFGNNFRITISGLSLPCHAIEKRITQTMEQLQSMGGAPNFFGHQRFGTTRSITHLVGKSLAKGNIKHAAMLFLARPSPHEHPSSREARKMLRSRRDFRKALEDFPKQLRYERLMLRQLAAKPDEFDRAFRVLPLKLLQLFVQAYQSYLFNRFLSKRIKEGHSLNSAEIGDCVVGVERSGLPLQAVHATVTAESLKTINDAVRAGKMRLAVPLVGFRQKLSQGVQGEIEKGILEEEKVNVHDFKIKSLPKISSKGELRTAITPINNLSLDQLRDASVKISFTLQRGSYATIVLREIMKPRNLIQAGF